MKDFAKLVILFSCLPVFASAGLAVCRFKTLGKELKIFTAFLFLSAIVQLITVLLWWFNKNNMPALHVYVAAGFICLAWFYNTVLSGFIHRLIIPVLTALFLLFTLLNLLYLQDIFTFNSSGLTVESVLIIILSFSTFMLTMNESVKDSDIPAMKSINWINSGLFIYYTSSLLIFYFGESITRFFPVELNRYTWVLHSFFSVIMYFCFFIGLWKSPRN
ncbi:MAG: hypothetical protein M3R17_17235 [Bacteroidota bacterium]|nr:hypothetical protein [Bacteroidota bacterium]